MAKTAKLKTHKGTSKRFRLTGSGKIIRKQQQKRNNQHYKANKSRSQKKLNPKRFVISANAEERHIKKLITT